jgi:hypothetical protein
MKLELNRAVAVKGEKIDTNTVYHRGNSVIQNISVRDTEGKVHTTNLIGGKILP